MPSLLQQMIAAAIFTATSVSHAGKADELPLGAAPATPGRGAIVEQQASSVMVVLDFAKMISFPQPARTIIIGNPAVVDGTLNDENTIVLTGKAVGTTNMIVLGEAGQEIANLDVAVTANTRQLTTVYHGAVQQTYSCSGPCRPIGVPAENK
jgi:Flp pilus assembly secretin CpaC